LLVVLRAISGAAVREMVQFAVSKDLIVVVLLYDFLPGGKVDTYQIPQNPTQATARRDAIAKV
jgi:hypothetical protein